MVALVMMFRATGRGGTTTKDLAYETLFCHNILPLFYHALHSTFPCGSEILPHCKLFKLSRNKMDLFVFRKDIKAINSKLCKTDARNNSKIFSKPQDIPHVKKFPKFREKCK